MSLITIHEIPNAPAEGPNAVVSFDGGPEHPVTVRDPFGGDEEALLAWYFEEHLRFPFTRQVDARTAAKSIAAYGEALFKQVFSGTAGEEYHVTRAGGVADLRFEIAGSPDFHRLHWEALKDPRLPRAFALEAPMIRKNLVPQALTARVRPSPTLNVLLVTARPGGKGDVGFRTISRPLVEGVEQAKVPVRIDILRPGTYQALEQHLQSARDERGAGFYHIVHFDAHGALLDYKHFNAGVEANRFLYQARYGREDIRPYDGLKAFLFLEGDAEHPCDPVEAGELADLLKTHQAPIAVLNACQSGMQVGVSETSLAAQLMTAGVQVALGMSYSVTVSAAQLLMTTLYEELFRGIDLAPALRRGRLELFNRKGRRAYFDQTIDLEDWLLPVVYQNQPARVETRDFTAEERQAHYERRARRFPFPEPLYGFVGRDLDILEIEKRLLRTDPTPHNLLLVRGMGGAGKTTLLRHLGAWWQATGFVDQVFYFGYDEKAHTRQQILHAVAEQLLGQAEYHRQFVPLSPEAGQAFLVERLRGERHLLILDNLESVTGEHLAVGNTLPEEERAALKGLLAGLAGGRTPVLLGSRGAAGWLMTAGKGRAAPLREEDICDLGGLDPEAASALAERILAYHKVTEYRTDPALARLLKLLDGYPLALEVVLANLKRQAPEQVLTALLEGSPEIDPAAESAEPVLLTKTESLLRCIDYSFGNLSPDSQGLLACLAPFTGVINTLALKQYTARLQAQPALADLPFAHWPEILQEAADWGLLGPHPEVTGMLRLQPVLPYFLRHRLAQPECAGIKAAVETAFREHYDDIGGALAGLLQSKEPEKRKLGQPLTRLEYENLHAALFLALEAQASIRNPYYTLSLYLDSTQDQRRGLELGEAVLARMEAYPSEILAGPSGVEFVGVLDNIAKRYLLLKRYPEAGEAYQKALTVYQNLTDINEKQKAVSSAGIYHQLGMVAQEQRQWAQAEEYYRQALQIYIDFNDRYRQAATYHQLGTVAEEQRQWAQAEEHYRQALQIYIDFNDRYEQADIYHQLGMVAEEQRQWAQAEEYYRQALQIKIDFNDRYSQASTYHQLGIVAQEQRQWAQAEEYYRQALQICIDFNDRYKQATIYHQLGRVAEEQRQWAQAEEYYRQALQIKIDFNDRYKQASTYHQLGTVAQEQRQWAQAEEYYRQALQIYIEYNDRHSQASTYHQLGMVAQEQRQWAQAEEYYRQALQIFIEYNDRHSQASTYHQLGRMAEEQHQWEQAREYYLQDLTISSEYQDNYGAAITMRSIARLRQSSGDAELPGAVAGVLGITAAEAEALLHAALEGSTDNGPGNAAD